MGTYSGKYNIREIGRYKEIFERENCSFSAPRYMHFQARKAGLTASFYTSGKFVIQGDLTDVILAKHFDIAPDPCKPENILPYPHIGVDESGKGDFLGPLVVAGVYLTENLAKVLQELGVCDSKKLNDKKILVLEGQIKAVAPYDVVVISPKKYNELYRSFKNLNKLLAWGHATVIENILQKQACECALCDKFGDERFISNALKEKGKQIKLVQKTKAEEDTAVAAASILARAEFIKRISRLAREYEMVLPKGASAQVLNAAKAFANKFGREELKNIAKLHFKTYEQV